MVKRCQCWMNFPDCLMLVLMQTREVKLCQRILTPPTTTTGNVFLCRCEYSDPVAGEMHKIADKNLFIMRRDYLSVRQICRALLPHLCLWHLFFCNILILHILVWCTSYNRLLFISYTPIIRILFSRVHSFDFMQGIVNEIRNKMCFI